MFTGIVEGKGRVLRVEQKGQGKRLALDIPADLTDLQLGDSINVNGACLTVVQKGNLGIEVDLSTETLQRTTLAEVRVGQEVNLERALQLSSRLGGHIVSGHIDGIGVILDKRKEKEFVHLRIRVPRDVSRYVVRKGSIAIDGTSLTVNECRGEEIQLTLIPYTLEKTILLEKKAGEKVNVEADIIGKYIEKLMERPPSADMSLSFLKEHGFISDE